MFRVNNKDSRRANLDNLFPSASTVAFEKVNVCWEVNLLIVWLVPLAY